MVQILYSLDPQLFFEHWNMHHITSNLFTRYSVERGTAVTMSTLSVKFQLKNLDLQIY